MGGSYLGLGVSYPGSTHPLVRLDGGAPHQAGWGYPPPLETEQHTKYLLCGGRYNPCVHYLVVAIVCSGYAIFWIIYKKKSSGQMVQYIIH